MFSSIKVFLYIIFTVSLFFVQSIYVHIFIAVAVFFLLALIPFKKVKQGIFPIGIFILFTFAGNLFSHSGKIIYSKGFLVLTDEGLTLAGMRALRVFSMIGSAKILTAMLTLEEIIGVMARTFRPLERIGVPVTEFFSVMGLTVRSFPVLTDYLSREYRKDIESNNIHGFRDRLRHVVLFLMPIFVKSIKSPDSFFAPRKNGTGS